MLYDIAFAKLTDTPAEPVSLANSLQSLNIKYYRYVMSRNNSLLRKLDVKENCIEDIDLSRERERESYFRKYSRAITAAQTIGVAKVC